MTTVLTQPPFDCGMQIIAQIKVKVFFSLLMKNTISSCICFFPDVSFNRYVYGVPGGVFIYTSFILNGVNVDDDDDIVGSEFKWPTSICDSALKRL